MSDKIKVVMIDDEEDLALVVKTNLEDMGNFEVATSSDPLNVESFIKQENPDIILLDNIMPGRKGSEIVQELRKKDADTRNIPIIMVSGKGEMVYSKRKDEFKWLPNNSLAKGKGDLPEGKSADALSQAYGVDDYLSKPFTTELLIEIIHEVVKKYRKKAAEKEEDESAM